MVETLLYTNTLGGLCLNVFISRHHHILHSFVSQALLKYATSQALFLINSMDLSYLFYCDVMFLNAPLFLFPFQQQHCAVLNKRKKHEPETANQVLVA